MVYLNTKICTYEVQYRASSNWAGLSSLNGVVVRMDGDTGYSKYRLNTYDFVQNDNKTMQYVEYVVPESQALTTVYYAPRNTYNTT